MTHHTLSSPTTRNEQTYPSIGLIGMGHMNRAILSGLLRSGYPPNRICAAGPHITTAPPPDAPQEIYLTKHNQEVISRSNLVIIGVKPNKLLEVINELKPSFKHNQPIMISLAASVRIEQIERCLGQSGPPVIRAMPNIAAQVGQSATVLCTKHSVDDACAVQVQDLFEKIGKVWWVNDESWFNQITSLSGSGPAFFFSVMESMTNAAVHLGLPESLASELVKQTAMGAAMLAAESQISPAKLARQVSSKGGGTEAALHKLSEGGMATLIQAGLESATNRYLEVETHLNHSAEKNHHDR